ncbi:MAG: PilZ domain-containing protein [Deltaproteobacteria bacterium]|nr:PilZ domain-containing protein [Deltaproteobacteria bacterium]
MVQKSAAAKATKAAKATTDKAAEPKEPKKPKKTAAVKIEEPPPPPPPPAPRKPALKAHRHLRAPIEIRVEVTARSQSFTTTSRNIALGGISFESQQQFRIGDLVNVLLYIPVRKDLELLKCASEIVWVEDLSGSWMCGAAFRKFAPGDERRLREWLLESVRAQKAGLTALPQPADFIDDDDG